MILDLTNVETQLLQILGAVLLAIGVAAGRLLLTKMHIQISDAKKAELEDVAQKALTSGLCDAQAVIAAKGWDHPDVKSAVVASAINYAIEKFSDTLKRSDIDPAQGNAGDQLLGIMNRKYPDAVAQAAASPATPPVRQPPVEPKLVTPEQAAAAPPYMTHSF